MGVASVLELVFKSWTLCDISYNFYSIYHLLLVFTHSGINFEPMGEVLVVSYLSFDANLLSELASFKDQPQMKRV